MIIAVHGGAGPAPAAGRVDDLRAGVAAAVTAGHAVLRAGGAALDAVEAAVVALEDDPRFNAGRGSVLAADGTVAMDAAIADGATGAAGAVAAVDEVRNPVRAARALLADGRAVLLAGRGARDFAAEHHLELRPPEWFHTDRSRARHAGRGLADPSSPTAPGRPSPATPGPSPAAPDPSPSATPPGPARAAAPDPPPDPAPPGTVGAVALDAAGHLAAATSTGGFAGKPPGRIGDSPLIGAGTWASDASAAISCTGLGEPIIRTALAHEIDALVRHAGLPLAAAADRALAQVSRLGGTAGLIAVDATGALALPFTTAAMSRAWLAPDGTTLAAVGRGAPRPFS